MVCIRWGREKKTKKGRGNAVNRKCLQASRQAGGWRLLSEAICYAPAILLFSHLTSYVSIPPFSCSLLLSSSHVSQHEASTSAIYFLCVRVRLHECVRARVCLSLCVGVGDKAVLQHRCVNKAPVCCLLLLITAQHNVSAQLAMHKIRCACVFVCACMRGERAEEVSEQTE